MSMRERALRTNKKLIKGMRIGPEPYKDKPYKGSGFSPSKAYNKSMANQPKFKPPKMWK